MKRAVGLSLLAGTFLATPTAALAEDPGFFLGRTAGLSDALLDSTVDANSPGLNVMVTNRTGAEAKLYGLLDGRTAVATVPARSAIVRLNWPSALPGRQEVKLVLVSGQAQDVEQHELHVRDSGYGYSSHYGGPTPFPTVRHTRPPSPSPSPSQSGQLAKTGHDMTDYLRWGGAMVLIGLLALGAAQVLGRRARRAESQ